MGVDDTRDLANNLREEGWDLRLINYFVIFDCLHQICATIFKKFPFNSTFLVNMRILNPTERLT